MDSPHSPKPDFTILPWTALEDVVRAFEFGARKYQRDGWRTVPDAPTVYLRASFRHLVAVARGEKVDSESGLPHLAHAAADVLIALEVGK